MSTSPRFTNALILSSAEPGCVLWWVHVLLWSSTRAKLESVRGNYTQEIHKCVLSLVEVWLYDTIVNCEPSQICFCLQMWCYCLRVLKMLLCECGKCHSSEFTCSISRIDLSLMKTERRLRLGCLVSWAEISTWASSCCWRNGLELPGCFKASCGRLSRNARKLDCFCRHIGKLEVAVVTDFIHWLTNISGRRGCIFLHSRFTFGQISLWCSVHRFSVQLIKVCTSFFVIGISLWLLQDL